MRTLIPLVSLLGSIVVVTAGAGCHADEAVPAVIDAAPVPCAVPGGACAADELCAHVCDCCGAPPSDDAGIMPSGHDTCVPDTGQCGAFFDVEGRSCQCLADGEAACPCA